MALEDLSFDDLARIVVEAVVDSQTSIATSRLLQLVHGDERVPSRVKDPDVLAALTVVVEKGWLEYSKTRFEYTGAPLVHPTRDGRTMLLRATTAMLRAEGRAEGRAEVYGMKPRSGS